MRAIWDALIHTPARDWLIAGVLALVFAIVADLLRVGSRIRDLARFVKSKASEQSVARLEKRIRELQQYRNSLNAMMSSDRALYLNALRLVLATLLLISFGAIIVVLQHLLLSVDLNGPGPMLDLLSIFAFAMAIVIALRGTTITLWDSRPKIAEESKKYEVETQKLIALLNVRLKTKSLRRSA